MSNKRPSAGHIPRPIGAPWNRSSAHTPEVLGTLNGAINEGVQRAITIFDRELAQMDITDEERAEVRADALPLIAQGITDGVKAFSESLKR